MALLLFVFVVVVTVLLLGVAARTYAKRRAGGVAPFHAEGLAQRVFFEGWYFKLVSRDGSDALGVIPGVYKNASQHFAFVHVLCPARKSVLLATYPPSEFSAAAASAAVVGSEPAFSVTVGKNRFSESEVVLDVAGIDSRGNRVAIRGRVTCANLNPWPVTSRSFGVMGFIGFLPLLETYHGVLSLNHSLAGELVWSEQSESPFVDSAISFAGGVGYTEKDWGFVFPRGYLWTQANHFRGMPRASLVFAVARMPLPVLSAVTVRGFFCGLLDDSGNLHVLATYKAHRIVELSIDQNTGFSVLIDARQHTLRIDAQMPNDASQTPDAAIPTPNGMEFRLKEVLSGQLHVTLSSKKKKKSPACAVFEGTSDHAAVEIHMPSQLLQ